MGEADFDIASNAEGLEELKSTEDKLKKNLSIKFENCEEDPEARLDIVIQFK